MTQEQMAALRVLAEQATCEDEWWNARSLEKAGVGGPDAEFITAANPVAVLALLDEVARLRDALGKITHGDFYTFHINPRGGPNIVVEGSDRFAHERDIDAVLGIARAALEPRA